MSTQSGDFLHPSRLDALYYEVPYSNREHREMHTDRRLALDLILTEADEAGVPARIRDPQILTDAIRRVSELRDESRAQAEELRKQVYGK